MGYTPQDFVSDISATSLIEEPFQDEISNR